MTDAAPDTGAVVRRGPGRPRDEDIDTRLVEAVLELIDAGQSVTVRQLVAHSGVSKAALYRRWPSLNRLVAFALDVDRRIPPEHVDGDDLYTSLLAYLGLGPAGVDLPSVHGSSVARIRQRISLVMADPALQKSCWPFVQARREPIERMLRRGVERGILRPDLDIDACYDAIVGTFCYQVVVRGEFIDAPGTAGRLREAIRLIWDGMTARGSAPSPDMVSTEN